MLGNSPDDEPGIATGVCPAESVGIVVELVEQGKVCQIKLGCSALLALTTVHEVFVKGECWTQCHDVVELDTFNVCEYTTLGFLRCHFQQYFYYAKCQVIVAHAVKGVWGEGGVGWW